MAFILKDRVKENSTTTGTGNISLGGAAATFDTFQSYLSNGDTTFYAVAHTSSGVDEWEVGLGTWNTGNTLSRTTVLAGSNGTSAVNFSAGTKDVFMTLPADKLLHLDANGDVDINGGTIDGTVIGAAQAAASNFTTIDATGNVSVGGQLDVSDWIDLAAQASHPAHGEGRLWYDNVHKTLNYYSDDSGVVHELGIEEHARVYNETGSTISKGTPVYFTGTKTSNGTYVPTIAAANATSSTKYKSEGMVAADIANNSYGYIITAGRLEGIDTSHLSIGQFFTGITDGSTQTAAPVYPNFPMCLGFVVRSDATNGVVFLAQQNHSIKSFRVQMDQHIGGNLTIDGNLNVTGSTNTTSTSDVTAGAPFYRANEGDAIGDANTTFTGSGLDDAFFAGHFTGTTPTTYYVKIDSVGTPDTFAVSTDNFVTTISTGTAITGSEQLIHSADNISVKFGATTGHTLNDVWTGTASPVNVDTGFFSNRNTGTSGVGYTHMGLFYDASESKWRLVDEYDPVPAGTIDTAHSSYVAGTIAANLEGNVTGNITGNVSGNAATASALESARTIGGVSFDGTSNINLAGVNTAGNQDTTGNAATATALESARTIQVSGDVTGSASFDGTSDITITTTVQDDSHAHVISNVDGLQTALDAKVPTSRIITAGNGLTGGGDLTANRTLTVGGGSGITVNADDIAIDSSYTGFDSRYVNVTGDTITGTLTLGSNPSNAGELRVNDTSTTAYTVAFKGTGTRGYAFEGSASSADYNTTFSNAGTGDHNVNINGHLGIGGTATDSNWADATHGNTEVAIDGGGGYGVLHFRGDGAGSTNTRYSIGVGDSIFYMAYDDVDGVHRAKINSSHQLIVNEGSGEQRVFHDGYHPNADDADTLDGVQGNKYFTSYNNAGTTGWEDSNRNFRINSGGTAVGFAMHESDGTFGFQLYGDGTYYGFLDANWGGWDIQKQINGALRVDEGSGLQRVFNDAYHPNADKWTTARTLSLSGDASGSVSWDGSANATLSVTVANDSHSHSNYITSNADDTGTGSYSTTGTYWEVKGDGGSVAMTTNDGYGNANITFNHRSGVPDKNGAACRIETNVDSSAAGQFMFEVSSGAVTAGTAVALTEAMYLGSNYIDIPRYIRHMGDTDTYLDFSAANSWRVVTGNTEGLRVEGNNVDIPNAIRHSGDTDTYFQFNAANTARVVCGNAQIQEWGTTYTLFGDNKEVRLGSGSDFRMSFNATNTVFRSYAHSGGDIYFQGEDTSGVNHALLYMYTNNTAPFLILHQDGAERLRTVGGGCAVTGLMVGSVASPHNAGGLQVNTNLTDEKIVLSGSSNPYIRWQEGTTDKAYIRWQTDGYLAFNNQESGNFRFRSHSTSQPVNIRLEASDGDLYGSVYGTHANEIGFLDQDGNWAYRHARDSLHEWSINTVVEMSLSASTLDMKGNTITEVEDIGLRDIIYHDGDTDTYMQFATNEIRLVSGGSQEVTINVTGVRLGDTGNGYFQPVSSNYGSIQIDGGAHGGWEGYNIGGRAVFMHDNSTGTGIYNDVDNEWLFYGSHNAWTRMYHNGSSKIETTSLGAQVNGTLNTTSDIRYKKNIEIIEGAIDKVNALRGVTFDWDNEAFPEDESSKKPNFTERATGVIAQEVEKVLPEAVNENPETGFKNVAYGNMVGLLIEAIKEQQTQINDLKAEIQSIKS